MKVTKKPYRQRLPDLWTSVNIAKTAETSTARTQLQVIITSEIRKIFQNALENIIYPSILVSLVFVTQVSSSPANTLSEVNPTGIYLYQYSIILLLQLQ